MTKWSVHLEFALRCKGDDEWETYEDTHRHEATFNTEAEARAFFDEAKAAVAAGWGDDQPGDLCYEFPKKHGIILYDLDGRVDEWYEHALLEVLRVTRFEDLTKEWEGG